MRSQNSNVVKLFMQWHAIHMNPFKYALRAVFRVLRLVALYCSKCILVPELWFYQSIKFQFLIRRHAWAVCTIYHMIILSYVPLLHQLNLLCPYAIHPVRYYINFLPFVTSPGFVFSCFSLRFSFLSLYEHIHINYLWISLYYSIIWT